MTAKGQKYVKIIFCFDQKICVNNVSKL